MYSILHEKCGEQYRGGEELVGRRGVKNQRLADRFGHVPHEAGPNKLDLPSFRLKEYGSENAGIRRRKVAVKQELARVLMRFPRAYLLSSSCLRCAPHSVARHLMRRALAKCGRHRLINLQRKARFNIGHREAN